MLASLPKAFPAGIVVALHVGPGSNIVEVLRNCCRLPVVAPAHSVPIKAGNVYVALPDFHIMVQDRSVALSRGPLENLNRPAIDPLFRSAARFFGNRAVGIILSGAMDDGAAGLFFIQQRGGLTIVQDPKDAQVPSMPTAALKYTKADYCLPAIDIGRLLPAVAKRLGKRKSKPAASGEPIATRGEIGRPIPVSCPHCHGPLYRIAKGPIKEIHCDIGHVFTMASLAEAHREALERALWIAIRTLRERGAVQKLAAEVGKFPKLAAVSKEAEEDVRRLEDIIRRI